MFHARFVGASLLAITLVLGACGGDDDDTAKSGDSSDTTQADQAATTEAENEVGEYTVSTADTDLGTILVDGEGKTLYGFTVDTAGTPTCSGGCATNWPAYKVDGEPMVDESLDASVFTTVAAVDGGMQLKAGDWPLYTYSGDSAPGDTNGQGVGGVWFVVKPDGSLIEQ
jgi:predicted lipoprotein with Yx(FWY)xxD motif